MACGADLEANNLIDELTEDSDFEIPNIDVDLPEFRIPGDRFGAMYNRIPALTNADLTEKKIDGLGTFDVIMGGFVAQLKEEYSKSRITGADYTKAFIAAQAEAMGGAISFLVQRDAVFWQSQQAQIQAITARLQHETVRMQLATAQFEAMTAKGNYALTKMKLAESSMQYCLGKFNLEYMLPQQLLVAKAQEKLVTEQYEAQRAQTMDTRSDNTTPIVGTMGKQRELYAQQIVSYKRDAEVKAAKLFTDAWITMKTIDEGLLPPNGFANSSLDQVLTTLKTNNLFQ